MSFFRLLFFFSIYKCSAKPRNMGVVLGALAFWAPFFAFPPSTTMAQPPPPPTLSRDQRAANRSAAREPTSLKSKSTSRKRQQSNADESINKRNKTATDNDDNINEAAIDIEEALEQPKGGRKSQKAKKTRKNMCVIFFSNISSILTYLPPLARRHWPIVNVKMKLRKPKVPLSAFNRSSHFSIYIYINNFRKFLQN